MEPWLTRWRLNSCGSVLECDTVPRQFWLEIMAQQETEHLTRIMTSAALSRAVSTIAELGVADLIQSGQPQPVEHLASASKTHEPSLYRILRFMASHGLFQETE